ncbi:MAG: winged helix-turn-helix domain-containing tetratricopeptide repeat protein [Alphaproteobacteria bacterium]
MLFAFGEYALDVERRELRRCGEPVALEPQVFDLLVHLVRNRDRVVGKDDLIDSVWGGRIVSDSAVTTRLNAARKAIGDSGAAQLLIRTIHRKGVRFVGEVRDEGSPKPEPVAAMIDTPPAQPPLALPDKPSIAVMAFQNMSGDPEQEYFADGVVEEIITALSRIRWLFVIARNSSFTYKGRTVDVKQIGRELGVRYVLEGSVRKAGQRMRITAQLIDAVTGAHLWADRFDGSLEDIFDLQDQVATIVAGIIEPMLQAAEIRRSTTRLTSNLTANDYYLQALPLIETYRWEPVLAGLDLLRQAIERDGGFASALALTAYGRAQLDAIGRVAERQDNRRIAIDLAQQTLRRAGSNGFALAAAGHVVGYFNEDSKAGLAIIDRGLTINPSFATGWHWSGCARLYNGRPEAAIKHFEMSIRVNPLGARWRQLTGIGQAHFFRQQFDNAATALLLALQENPHYPLALRFLASCYMHMGRPENAQKVVARLRAITPMVIPADTNYRDPEQRDLFLSGLRLAAGEPQDDLSNH